MTRKLADLANYVCTLPRRVIALTFMDLAVQVGCYKKKLPEKPPKDNEDMEIYVVIIIIN